jgi:hypothetical protein
VYTSTRSEAIRTVPWLFGWHGHSPFPNAVVLYRVTTALSTLFASSASIICQNGNRAIRRAEEEALDPSLSECIEEEGSCRDFGFKLRTTVAAGAQPSGGARWSGGQCGVPRRR